MKLGLLLLPVGLAAASAIPAHPIAHVHIDPTGAQPAQVLIYSSGVGAFAVGTDSVRLRGDTIRAVTPLNIVADLVAGDLHIVSVGMVNVDVKATMIDAPASRLSGVGQHLVLDRGGSGIHREP